MCDTELIYIVLIDFAGIHKWSSRDIVPLTNELYFAQNHVKKYHNDPFTLENALVFCNKVAFIFNTDNKRCISSYMAYLEYTDPLEYELEVVSTDTYDKFFEKFGRIYHRHAFCS